MNERVPHIIRETLGVYLALLEKELPGRTAGVYLHGSIALDAFDPATSDIDFAVMLHGALADTDRDALHRVHAALRSHGAWGARLEGFYSPIDSLAADIEATTRYPYIKHGAPRGTHRLGWAERRILRERGVVIAGPAPASVLPAVTRAQLDAEMLRNLHEYWAGRARRPYLFLRTDMVRFAVATLPRILVALETGDIIAKPEAVALLAERFPEWGVFADAAVRDRARFGGPLRALRCRRFVRAMIAQATR